MRVAIAQIAPVFLDRDATLERVRGSIAEAREAGAGLVAFSESLVPGYPTWLSSTGGARFNDDLQKELHARFHAHAVCIEDGHLDGVCDAAADAGCWTVLGVTERPRDRTGHTLYCSAVTIDDEGAIRSVHRKLMPTYEERLCWGVGDGHGLRAHRLDGFTLGTLNCWENWMPLARASLYAQGVDVHVMLWPGTVGITRDITRFVARESRSYVVSASSLLAADDIPADIPARDAMAPGGVIHDGGSAIAGPDGEWIVEPVADRAGLITADLDPTRVARERQNFDPAGHYSRPDVLQLWVDRTRQTGAEFDDE